MVDWYHLSNPSGPEPGRVVTQAFILCVACRKALRSTGGPGRAICADCVAVAQDVARAKRDGNG